MRSSFAHTNTHHKNYTKQSKPSDDKVLHTLLKSLNHDTLIHQPNRFDYTFIKPQVMGNAEMEYVSRPEKMGSKNFLCFLSSFLVAGFHFFFQFSNNFFSHDVCVCVTLLRPLIACCLKSHAFNTSWKKIYESIPRFSIETLQKWWKKVWFYSWIRTLQEWLLYFKIQWSKTK